MAMRVGLSQFLRLRYSQSVSQIMLCDIATSRLMPESITVTCGPDTPNCDNLARIGDRR
jgi:hypothetical protein